MMSEPTEERRFAELRALKEGWDSYGGLPVQDGVEARAKAILALLRTDPIICPTPSGGIQLEWRINDDDYGTDDSVEIEVEPNGGLSLFIEGRER